MNVLNYMAMQKAKLRAKYSGEEFFIQCAAEKNAPVHLGVSRPAEVILDELDGMEGLNVAGRRFFAFSRGSEAHGKEKFSKNIYPTA